MSHGAVRTELPQPVLGIGTSNFYRECKYYEDYIRLEWKSIIVEPNAISKSKYRPIYFYGALNVGLPVMKTLQEYANY